MLPQNYHASKFLQTQATPFYLHCLQPLSIQKFMFIFSNHCFDIVIRTSPSLGSYFRLNFFGILETSKSRNLLQKLSTIACTYMTSIKIQTSWRKMKSLPSSCCRFVIITFFVITYGLFLHTFATCSQTLR